MKVDTSEQFTDDSSIDYVRNGMDLNWNHFHLNKFQKNSKRKISAFFQVILSACNLDIWKFTMRWKLLYFWTLSEIQIKTSFLTDF